VNGTRYGLLLLALRQSALAPALTYLALVAAVYASDAGPPVAAGTVTAAGLLPICAWLGRLVAGAESDPFADITLLRLGGPVRRQLTWWCSTMLVAAAFTVVAVVWARIANPHPYSARTLVLLVVLHLLQAACGAGLGGWLARPYHVSSGAAVLVVTAVLVLSLVIHQVPPLGPMIKAFAADGSSDAAQVAAVAEAAAVAVVLVAGCCLFSRRAATR
jgi:hypothetical protein